MATHVIHFNARNGDLVDLEYFDSASCMFERLDWIIGGYDPYVPRNVEAGRWTDPTGTSLDWGAWPCPDFAEYEHVVCAYCGSLMHQATYV